MTLLQVIRQLERIALTQHNVRYAADGDIFKDLNSNQSVKYDVVYLTQNQHQSEGEFDRYNLNIFYISRLENMDGDNTLQIQSIGKEVIENMVKIFCDQFDADVYGTTYWQAFKQKFADETAGIYCIIVLEVPKDSVCVDE